MINTCKYFLFRKTSYKSMYKSMYCSMYNSMYKSMYCSMYNSMYKSLYSSMYSSMYKSIYSSMYIVQKVCIKVCTIVCTQYNSMYKSMYNSMTNPPLSTCCYSGKPSCDLWQSAPNKRNKVKESTRQFQFYKRYGVVNKLSYQLSVIDQQLNQEVTKNGT